MQYSRTSFTSKTPLGTATLDSLIVNENERWVDAGNPTCTQMAFLCLWAISVAAAINNFMPSV